MDRPIIFSAPMVRALINGRKTMTRRIAYHADQWVRNADGMTTPRPTPWQRVQPGDRLWVRESGNWTDAGTCIISGRRMCFVSYMADPGSGAFEFFDGKKRPSIHMPRWASRLTLTVTAVRIERLQEITPADVRAEGLLPATSVQSGHAADDDLMSQWHELWNTLHGPGAWEANPDVVVIGFDVAKRNIDAPEDPQ